MTLVNEHHDERAGLNSFEHVAKLLTHMRMEWLLLHLPPRLVWAVYVGINGFITIALLALLSLVTGSPFVFPSLGPTAFLFFFSPLSESSSPRNTIFGHAIGLVCGYAAFVFAVASSAPFWHEPRCPWPAGAGRRALALGYRRAHGSAPGKSSAGGSDDFDRFARDHLSTQGACHYRGRSHPAYNPGLRNQSARWYTLSHLEKARGCGNRRLAWAVIHSRMRLLTNVPS